MSSVVSRQHFPDASPAAVGDARARLADRVRALLRALLRLPLRTKLVGANVLVAIVATAALVSLDRLHGGGTILGPAVVVLWVTVAASTALIHVALSPLTRLNETLQRVADGELGVRVRPSAVADRDLLRVGDTVNTILDELVAERARIRQLARETIRSADEERSRIARGLHDSTAQTLAALSLEARIALQHGGGGELKGQLELIRELAIGALEEVRDLSHTIHPRVLDDLGLAAALGWLARCTGESSEPQVSLHVEGDGSHLPLDVSCTLFRVAEAALADAARRGARSAEVRLSTSDESVDLDVADDGTRPDDPANRLHSLVERLALASGELTIDGNAGHGARVHAFVPLGVEIT